jgi:hypothetical protein
MSPRPFFTRGPGLAFLKRLIEGSAGLDWGRADIAAIFRAVDAACAELFPTENRGGWFSPVFLGGVGIHHIPPHLVFAVYAVYADLRAGCPLPVPFLSAPLDLDATTAVQLEPSEAFQVTSPDGTPAPLTDILVVIPAKMSEQWSGEVYGTPHLQPDVVRLSWNTAAASLPTALATGQLFLHPASGRVLNPLDPDLGEAEEGDFFAEPLLPSRLTRYRERLSELCGTPLEVMARNHETAKGVVEAYLALPCAAPLPRRAQQGPDR